MIPKISELTPEQMRAMCAEACGCKKASESEIYDAGLRFPSEIPVLWTHKGRIIAYPSKYDTSLDAMAEAEATLTDEEHYDFRGELARQCIEPIPLDERSFQRKMQSCTALQRLAAFLVAKGLAQP